MQRDREEETVKECAGGSASFTGEMDVVSGWKKQTGLIVCGLFIIKIKCVRRNQIT